MSDTTTASIGASAAVGAWEAPGWRKMLAPYTRPRISRSVIDILTSVVPYLALITASYFLIDVSYLIVLALSIPAAGFLVRTFILFHDCGHGSFLPSSRANQLVGSVCAVLVFMPFERWRHQHAVHHATSGDLERRGTGDVPTKTVDEYYAMPWKGRLGYRLFRNPIVMFGLGPIWAQIIGPRMISRDERPRLIRSVWRTNVVLALIVGTMCWLLGWQEFLLIQVPSALLAGSAGIWLFYVQHQFEDAYWESQEDWSYDDAALRGSSYLKLPKILQFFSGNIGLHHVHHLSARIPNYNLQRAHDENEVFHSVPTLTLWDGIKCMRLKVWDERSQRMVGWRQARASHKAASANRAVAAPESAF